MASTEHIEAKLAAYVEGQLDPADRAEIEQHLAANPQHRTLLEELREIRGHVTNLPRESAPPEVMDRVYQHLERSMLLGEKREDTAVAGRINPWPSVVTLAAMLMLAIGLGAIVFFSLPSARPPKVLESAMKDSPTAEARTEVALADKTKALDTGTAVAIESIGAKPAAVAGVLPKDSDILGSAKSKDPFADRGLSDSTNAVPGKSQSQPTSPVFVVVTTEDPSASQVQINEFLRGNNISWEEIKEPLPAPIAIGTQNAFASRAGQSSWSVQSQGSTTQPGQPAQPGAPMAMGGGNGSMLETRTQLRIRNITRGKAMELNNALNGGAINTASNDARSLNNGLARNSISNALPYQRAEFYDSIAPNRPANPTALALRSGPSTQPTYLPGDQIQVTVNELVGPGLNSKMDLKVSEDGTISLPMLGVVRATGTTDEELKSRIAGGYKELGILKQASVTVEKKRAETSPASQPTSQPSATQPVGVESSESAVAETPAVNGVAAIPSADSQPTDLVLIVQSPTTRPAEISPAEALPAVPSSTRPATQPVP